MLRTVRLVVLLAALGLMVSCGALIAQELPNLNSAEVLPPGQTLVQTQARFFEGSGNETLAVGIRSNLDARRETSLWYTAITNRGEDPLAGSVRESKWHALSLAWKQEVSSNFLGKMLAVVASVDLSTSGPRGTNLNTGAYAEMDGVIPAVALPLQWQHGQTTWVAEGKVVWFENTIPNSWGGTTEGFGRIVMLGLGVTSPFLGGELIADVSAPVSGGNVIDETTGRPDDALVWSLGWRNDILGAGMPVDLYATNASGPSLAASALAAPDNSIGFGISITRECR